MPVPGLETKSTRLLVFLAVETVSPGSVPLTCCVPFFWCLLPASWGAGRGFPSGPSRCGSFGMIMWAATPESSPSKNKVISRFDSGEMNNSQLRAAMLAYVSRLRKFNNEFQILDRRLSEKEHLEWAEEYRKIPEAERNTPGGQAKQSRYSMRSALRGQERREKFKEAFTITFVDAQLLDSEYKKRISVTDLISDLGLKNCGGGNRPRWALARPETPCGDLVSHLERAPVLLR